MDKTARLFIKGIQEINMYVTDPTYSYEALVIKILTNNFYSMLEEVLDLKVFWFALF
jgi:hypothetical protein